VKTYLRYYRAFENVPDEVLPELRRLNLGLSGIMADLIPWTVKRKKYISGWECPRSYWTSERHIAVAYDAKTDKVAGWSVTDWNGCLNLYVAHRYRRKGVAHKLARHMLRFVPSKFRVYNLAAETCVRKAMARSKYKKSIGMM